MGEVLIRPVAPSVALGVWHSNEKLATLGEAVLPKVRKDRDYRIFWEMLKAVGGDDEIKFLRGEKLKDILHDFRFYALGLAVCDGFGVDINTKDIYILPPPPI